MNVVSLFVTQALAEPDRTAFISGGRALSYGQLLLDVKRQAACFTAAGVSRGDVVALAASQLNVITATLALAWIGAVSAEVEGGQEEVREIAAALKADYLFCMKPEAYATLAYEGFRGAFRLQTDAEGPDAAGPVAAVEPTEPWHIALSSGTTGQRKGIVYSHESTVVNVNLLRVQYPLAPDDRVLIGMSAVMAFAMANWLRCLTTGACAVLMKSPLPEAVLGSLHDDGITHALLAAGTAGKLARLAASKKGRRAAPPARLRALSVGGAKVSIQLQQMLQRHVCDSVYIHYGSTEANLIAVHDNATRARFPASSGRRLPWVEVEAVDDEGKPLPPGNRGALRIRSAVLASAYRGATDPDDLNAFRDGWFYSSDVGTVFPDGIVRLHGRANDVLNFGGAKVDPALLEDAILEDASITECAVVDVPDDIGQPILAVVVVRDTLSDLDTEGLRDRCLKVSPNSVPRLVLKAAALPRNSSGKVKRQAVRKAVEASSELAALHKQRKVH